MNVRTWFLAAALLAACDPTDGAGTTTVDVTVRHPSGNPAADVRVESLGDSGRIFDATRTDINGEARVRVRDDGDPAWNLRVDETHSYFDIPRRATEVQLTGESVERDVTVTFRPVLAPGDTWFMPLLDGETSLVRRAAGEALTVRVAALPRVFFVVAGNDSAGVRHATRIAFDGAGDIVFSDLIGDDFGVHGNRVTVEIAGQSQVPACAAAPFPTLRGGVWAVTYPHAATGLTVYAFTENAVPADGGVRSEPMTLRCSFVAEAGACLGATVTGVIPLMGGGRKVELDWSTVSLVPLDAGDATVLAARVFHDGSDQAYLRDKGGFCMLPRVVTPLTSFEATLAVGYGELELRTFLDDPDRIDVDVPAAPGVATADRDGVLELTAGCTYCFQVARVTGTYKKRAAVAYAPVDDGEARIPTEVFDRRDAVEVYGYGGSPEYAVAVTLPMRGYPVTPGGSRLVPASFTTSFYRWISAR